MKDNTGRLVFEEERLGIVQRDRRREQILLVPPLRVERPSKLRGAAAIGQAVGAVLGRRKMAKHFTIAITNDSFSFSGNARALEHRHRLTNALNADTAGIFETNAQPSCFFCLQRWTDTR